MTASGRAQKFYSILFSLLIFQQLDSTTAWSHARIGRSIQEKNVTDVQQEQQTTALPTPSNQTLVADEEASDTKDKIQEVPQVKPEDKFKTAQPPIQVDQPEPAEGDITNLQNLDTAKLGSIPWLAGLAALFGSMGKKQQKMDRK